MHILQADATFAKLDHAHLEFTPGLNILCAPNEGGKSTWSKFLLSMFYGLNTRQRGDLADKNRYRPWSGAPMNGRLQLEQDGRPLTLIRSTSRHDSPLSDFSCTYADTNIPISDVTAPNCGDLLLGVPQSVYQRCAFISSGAMALDDDPELERRISSLISTGEEQVSFSQVEQRLKKQLRFRKYNSSGSIPRLEEELAALESDLRSAQALSSQIEDITRRLDALRQEQLYAQQQDLQRSAHLQEQWQSLPDSQLLRSLDEELGVAKGLAEQTHLAKDTLTRYENEVGKLEQFLAKNPLYPITKQELEAQLQHTLAVPPSLSQLLIPLSLALCSGGFLWYSLDNPPIYLLPLSAACVALSVGVFFWLLTRRIKRRKAFRLEKRRQDALLALAEEYLPLLERLEERKSGLEMCRQNVAEYDARLRAHISHLLEQARAIDPSVSSLADIRRLTGQTAARREELSQKIQAEQTELLQKQTSCAEQNDRISALQRQLAQLQGQLVSLGTEDAISRQIAAKQRQLQTQQAEYDALSMALEALQTANNLLHSRFSPELSRRAAKIFSELTDAPWEHIVLDRDFQLSAATESDPTRRSVQLLSNGTADQLYLATRLAICELILPQKTNPPLILDDALLTFDDARLRKTLDWLCEAAKSRQILLFTCQGREAAYLSDRADVHIASI